MSDDYLFDRSGPIDPGVEELERALAPSRVRATRAEFLACMEASEPTPTVPRAEPPRRTKLFIAVAAAATLAAAAMAPIFLRAKPTPGTTTRVEPTPSTSSAPGPQWIVTEGLATRIDLPGIGRVHVDPETKVRIVASSALEQRLELVRGSITARVVAPPRLFIVETPAATAVDLGCEYKLSVDDAGTTLLSVRTGAVSLERGRVAALVPEGAECRARRDTGPGTPYFADASPTLLEALAKVDAGDGGALPALLAAARARDTLTLVHLLDSAADARAAVLDRIEALCGKTKLDRAALLRGDAKAIAAYRDELAAHW